MKLPNYKGPKVNKYSPELGMPSSGPTTTQPDVAGPIAGVALKLAEVVQDYQNVKINTSAKLQKETTKNNSIFDLKQLEQEFENKINKGDYSGVDTSGKLRNPLNARLDFEKVAEKYLKEFVKKNSDTPLGEQTIKESYDLLRYQIGESKNKFDDLANVEIKKNAISTYQINYNDFRRSIEDSTSPEELETLSLIQLNNLENIKYSMNSETYLKEVERIKTDVFIKSVSFQAGADNPNEILAYIVNGNPITQPVDLAEEYFQKTSRILDPVFGNRDKLNAEDKAKLDKITKEYENNQITQLKKTKTLSPNDPRIIAAIKTLKSQTKVYNEAVTSQQTAEKRNGYASINKILHPIRGELDLTKINEAQQKAYEIANQASGETRAKLRTYIDNYFTKGPSNQKMTKYFNDIAEIGGLTKEFRDELDEAVTLGAIKADVANRIIGLHNLNVKKYEDLDEQALKYGLRYLIQKMDPNKVKNLDKIYQANQGEKFDFSQIVSLNITEKTLRALKLYQDTLLEGEAKGLNINQIIYDKKFEIENADGTTTAINALDHVINIVKEETIIPFDVVNFPVDVYDVNTDGTVTYDEVDMVEGTGTFVRSNIVDVLATVDQKRIAKRRKIGEREMGDGTVTPIYESIESRSERIALEKNLRRAMQTKKFTPKELMEIAEIFGFTLDDIKKEVNAINKEKPITSIGDRTVFEELTPGKPKTKKKKFNPATQEFE